MKPRTERSRTQICDACGEAYEAVNTRQKYCSRECYYVALTGKSYVPWEERAKEKWTGPVIGANYSSARAAKDYLVEVDRWVDGLHGVVMRADEKADGSLTSEVLDKLVAHVRTQIAKLKEIEEWATRE